MALAIPRPWIAEAAMQRMQGCGRREPAPVPDLAPYPPGPVRNQCED